MALSVNGIVIDARRVADEINRHRDVADPEAAARRALVRSELLRQRVRDLRLLDEADAANASDDAIIDTLFTRDVQVRRPTEAECRAYFHEHAGQFRVGDKVQASHILFALSAGVPLSSTLERAQSALDAVLAEPASFESVAARMSDCPSGRRGGSLGMLARGSGAPEFELVLFCGDRLGVVPRLVNTRYGFHVVRIERRVKGRMPPFERVADRIAAQLYQQARARALHHYVALLADAAQISGAGDNDRPARVQ
ncbi:peptidylprolyl isomerase [Pandoraea nosoerga]|uniref:peptidylprolyl isomerase n=1 Tax=Pandoraea nosoerga TaxID=2508296 RepID=A0A5E4UVT4_9BURK|nr:peptidylprolyl isomerase [Pandoraea nosoerga]MBN4666546.1 peptidylprolyl isomerase [Pandoraea nosoerga]MBN4674211.1 peptidylprolyl isomerase [Pandoraea nosoerga]MBN4679855.1 peptidylprolyl isomerase [Pandoraea nosoerga]MBN4746793.1 peptidylprolyl isomerase [Pandoraea nosoerga]VVE03673.1 peptidylprolyl isomerase [Pandoraea nosoerga]